MNKSLVDALKQAINGDDCNDLDIIIEKDIQKIEDNNDFRRYLYNICLLENDISIKRDLSVLLAPFLNEKYMETISEDKALLNQLKNLEVGLSYRKVDFFVVVASVIKERELLDKILTSQDIEQIYAECLQGNYSHPVFGLLETSAMYNNVEFIDIFLHKAEQDLLNKVEQEKLTKQHTGSQESINSLGSDESCDSGIDLGNSDESDVDLNQSYGNSRLGVNAPIDSNKLNASPAKFNSLSNTFTKKEILEKLTTNLANVLSTAISIEAYETVNYLYDKFNKTDSIEIKAAFIIALEHDDVKKEYKKQQTERPNSVKIIKLMKEWHAIKYFQLRFQIVKSSIVVEDNINRVRQAGFCKNSKDFNEKMEAACLSLNELKNSVINILHTSIDYKNYDLIKNLFNDFNDRSIDTKDVFDRALKDENVQKGVKNSKKIKKILYNDKQSILKMMENIILRIKDLVEQIINYFSMEKDIKKQSFTMGSSTLPSSKISLISVHNDAKCVDAALSRC